MMICIESDYDNYFRGLAEKIVSYVTNPKYERVIVTAGPYRPYALTVNERDPQTANLDFYSAIRNGFGSLSEQDLHDAAKLLQS